MFLTFIFDSTYVWRRNLVDYIIKFSTTSLIFLMRRLFNFTLLKMTCSSSWLLCTFKITQLLYIITPCYVFLCLLFFHVLPFFPPPPFYNPSLPQHPPLKIYMTVRYLHLLRLPTVSIFTYVKTSWKNHKNKYVIQQSTKWSYNLADLPLHSWWLLCVVSFILHNFYSLYLLYHLCLVPLALYDYLRQILWIVWCLMGLGGLVYDYLWGSLVYIICRVLVRLDMCMCWGGMCIVLTISGLWCLGAGFVGCRHLLGYNTLCVGYLVYCFVVSWYTKAFYVWVDASGE